MASRKTIEHVAATLPFETFWAWLQTHPNCILRAGTPETVVYDEDELHWHFIAEGAETLVVQVMRGKSLVAEIVVVPSDIAYVQGVAGEEEEYVFELVSETERERVAAYHFVLSHGYDAQESVSPGRRVH